MSLPLSVDANATFEQVTRLYKIQVVREAERVARRHGADTISAADIREGAQHLKSRDTHTALKHLAAFGGIGLGISASFFLNLDHSSPSTYILILAISVFLIALDIAKCF